MLGGHESRIRSVVPSVKRITLKRRENNMENIPEKTREIAEKSAILFHLEGLDKELYFATIVTVFTEGQLQGFKMAHNHRKAVNG